MKDINDMAKHLMTDEINPTMLRYVVIGATGGFGVGLYTAIEFCKSIKAAKDTAQGLSFAAATIAGSSILGFTAIGVCAGIVIAKCLIEKEEKEAVEKWLIQFDDFIQMLEKDGFKADAEALKRARECLRMEAISPQEFLRMIRVIVKKYCENPQKDEPSKTTT